HRETRDRHDLDGPDHHEPDEDEEERAAEVHAASEALRDGDRRDAGDVRGQCDRNRSQEGAAAIERGIFEEERLHEREGEDREHHPLGGRGDEQASGHAGRLRVALRDGLRPQDVHQTAFTAPARIPGSTTRYAIGIVSSPHALTTGAARRCSPTMSRGSLLFNKLMKKSASAWGERLPALAGNRMTGTFAAPLIARTVSSTLPCVTPVDPPTMIASVPASPASPARDAASSAVCLSGSRSVM